MSQSNRIPAIDADGHIMERRQDFEPYLAKEWQGRSTPLWPGGYRWDADMGGKLGTKGYGYKRDLNPKQQVEFWHKILDEYEMEKAVLFPTGCGSMMKLREPGFAEAATQAANRHFASDYMTDRLRPVGVLPMNNPAAAVEEVRRVAKLGLPGVEVLTDGLHYGLGNPIFDPVYAEAEKLNVAICIHGTRANADDWGSQKLSTFSEVHAYAFPAGMLLNFTSVMCQGVPVKFPELRIGFLEVGATWLPYYLSRLDEHWYTRGEVEMPVLKKKPSDIFRESHIIVSLEADEPLIPETAEIVGIEHLVFASDIPHWDGEFPGNLNHIRETGDLTADQKKKILYDNPKAFFRLS